MTAKPLCHIDDIAEGNSLGIESGELALIAIKKRGQLYLYHNRCPHVGIRLEWQPHQFLDADKTLIQCSSHGALFTIDKGRCVAGPCTGQSLQSIAFEIIDGQVYLLA